MNCPHQKVVRATFRHGDPRLGLFEVFCYCAECWLVMDKPDGTPYMTVSDLQNKVGFSIFHAMEKGRDKK